MLFYPPLDFKRSGQITGRQYRNAEQELLDCPIELLKRDWRQSQVSIDF